MNNLSRFTGFVAFVAGAQLTGVGTCVALPSFISPTASGLAGNPLEMQVHAQSGQQFPQQSLVLSNAEDPDMTGRGGPTRSEGSGTR